MLCKKNVQACRQNANERKKFNTIKCYYAQIFKKIIETRKSDLKKKTSTKRKMSTWK